MLRPFRKQAAGDAAMSERKAGSVTLPRLHARRAGDGPILTATGLAKSFGGIKAVEGVDLHHGRPAAACADRPQRRRQDHRLQPDLRDVRARPGRGPPARPPDRRAFPRPITQAGIGRAFQITNLFPDASVEENVRLAVQARAHRSASVSGGPPIRSTRSTPRRRDHRHSMGWTGSSSGGRLAELWRPAPARHVSRWRRAARAAARRAARRPCGGRARARRQSDQVDLDRLPGAAGRARHRPRLRHRRPCDGDERGPGSGRRHGGGCAHRARVQEVYIGSGRPRDGRQAARKSAARAAPCCWPREVDTFYGKSHILQRCVFRPARGRDRRPARPQRRRQIDPAQDASSASRRRQPARSSWRAKKLPACAPPRSPAPASPMCRRGAACSPA